MHIENQENQEISHGIKMLLQEDQFSHSSKILEMMIFTSIQLVLIQPYPLRTNSDNISGEPPDIQTSISKHVDITDDLLQQLENSEKTALVEAAINGEELYEIQEFEGDQNLYSLCERYLRELDSFIYEGIENEFIT